MAASIANDIIDVHCDVKAPVLDIAQQMIRDEIHTDNAEIGIISDQLFDNERLNEKYIDGDSKKDCVISKESDGNTTQENEAKHVGLVVENINSVAELPTCYRQSLDTHCTEYLTYNQDSACAEGSISAESYMPYMQPGIIQDTQDSQNPYEMYVYQGTNHPQVPVYYVENSYQQNIPQMNYSNAHVPFVQYQPAYNAYQYQTQYAEIPAEINENIHINHGVHNADPNQQEQGALSATTQAVFVNCQQPQQQPENRSVTEQSVEPMAWSQGTPQKATSIDESEIKEMKNRLQQSSLFKKVTVENGITVNATDLTQVPMEKADEVRLAPPSFYQNVPPPNMKVPGILCSPIYHVASIAATVTTPSGEKLYIPLDDSLYEVKNQGHGLDDIPEATGDNVFKKESELDGFSQEGCSPRPVQMKGSLSDEEASESDYHTDASRSLTSLSTKSSETCISESDIIEVEENKDNNDNEVTAEVPDSADKTDGSVAKSKPDECQEGLDIKVQECEKTTKESVTNEVQITTVVEPATSNTGVEDAGDVNGLIGEVGASANWEEINQMVQYGPVPEQLVAEPYYVTNPGGVTENGFYTEPCFYLNQDGTLMPQQNESPIGESYHFNEAPLYQPAWNIDPGNEFVINISDDQTVEPDSTSIAEPETVYPALHVSEDGLVTVILRHGVFLEMTTDKSLRLVCHDKKLVVATDIDGRSACLIHPAAKIFQSGTIVDVDLYLARKVKIMTENTFFGNNFNTYVFDYTMVDEMAEFSNFLDQSEDRSVGFLNTDTGFFNFEVAMRTSEIVSRAYFEMYQTKGCKVVVNGVKIVQNDNGDVSVYSGPIKFLRLSPLKSVLRLKSPFLEADIETNWNVKVRRGTHTINASYLGLILSNGKIKACIDQKNKLQAFTLPDHRRLNLGQQMQERRPAVPRQKYVSVPGRRLEPEGDHVGYP